MQMLHFRVPTSCNGMRLNIFLRTMGVSSACIKAVKYQGTGFCVRHCGVQQMGVIYPAQDKAALPTCCLQGSAKLLANTARCHGFLCKQDGFIVG